MSEARNDTPGAGPDRHRPGRSWLAWGGAGLLALALLGGLHFVPLPTGPRYAICLFRRSTGLSCFGCGLTRSVAALARLDWSASFRMHPLGPLIAIEAALGWVWWGAVLLCKLPPLSNRWIGRLAVAHVFLLAAVWLVRLLTGTLPP